VRLHSLTSRFLATLVVSTTLPFAVFGWFVITGMRDRVEGQVVSAYLPDKAATAAREIEGRVEQIDQACQVALLAVGEHIGGDGKAFDENAFAENVELAPGLLGENADLVLLTDADGKILYKSRGYGRAEQAFAEGLIPRSVGGEEWFEQLRSAQGGGRAWLPWARSPYLHRNPEHQSRDPSDYNFGVVYRLGSGNEFGGVLLVLVRCSNIQELLDQTRRFLREDAGLPSAEVFLMDGRGRTIAHTDRERYGRMLEPDGLRQAVAAATERADEVAFVGADGVRRLAGFARIGKVAGGQWWVGLHADRTELFSTSADFARVLVFAIVVTVVILVLWSLIASRAILRPVRRLVAATGAVARGDLSARVPAGGRHELADLGRAFNSMTEELSSSRESLKQAERQAAWAEMARQVAHEIKNPLTPMRMAAQLLLKSRRDKDPRAEQLAERLGRMVVEQTEALDRIASDFRHFAGAPERQIQRFVADELLAELFDGVNTMVTSSEVHLEFEPGADGATIEGDRHELHRVFLNLVSNAVDAGRGRVRLHWSSARGVGADGRPIVIVEVSDDGPGISEEAQARLFEPYFTTKSSGTGLGLAICRRIVEAHGGSIRLASTEPGRTVFRLEFPERGAAEPESD